MKKALIILALLASPAYARKAGQLNQNYDYVMPKSDYPKSVRDPYMDPRPNGNWLHDTLDIITIIVGDHSTYSVQEAHENVERRRRIQDGTINIPSYTNVPPNEDPRNPYICQWDVDRSATVCAPANSRSSR